MKGKPRVNKVGSTRSAKVPDSSGNDLLGPTVTSEKNIVRVTPRAVWASRKDRERTKNHRWVKKQVQGMARRVWRWIPDCCRQVIMHGLDPHSWQWLNLVNEPWTGKNRWGHTQGGHHAHHVYLNVNAVKWSKTGRFVAEYVLAHEWAHTYYYSLYEMAAVADIKRSPDKIQRTFLYAEIPYEINEVMADALAVAWGFGFGFATSIANDLNRFPGCIPDDLLDSEIEFARQMHPVYECWREAFQGPKEEV